MSFSQLKKQSSLGNLTSKLVKEVEKMNGNGGGSGADERFWKPEVDRDWETDICVVPICCYLAFVYST